MAYTSFPRLPRPRSFFYLMSLRTGTEFITFALIINKLSGLYGILAILTGVRLSPLQLSMYLYSILALALASYLAPHIRRQSPLQCLALAWLYLLDSLINAAYTAAFGIAWFLVLARHDSPTPALTTPAPGADTIEDAAGFTNPSVTVASVDVVATPAAGTIAGQDAALIGHPPAHVRDVAAAAAASPGTLHATMLEPSSIASVTIIAALWLVRLYALLVVLTYARRTLRQHVAAASQTASGGDRAFENPFAVGREEGQGWRGRLGRAMVSVGKGYWLGVDEAEDWSRVQARGPHKAGEATTTGVFERERRRRAGTGPPPPPPNTKPVQLDNLAR